MRVQTRGGLTLAEAQAYDPAPRGVQRRRPPVAADPRTAPRRPLCDAARSTHGKGMAREHLPRLTERFYRVEGQKSGEQARHRPAAWPSSSTSSTATAAG